MIKKLIYLAGFFYMAYQGALVVQDMMDPYAFDEEAVYHTFR